MQKSGASYDRFWKNTMNLNSAVMTAANAVLPTLLGNAGKQRLMILIYHRVLANVDAMMPGEPDAAQFDWQMALLAKYCSPLGLAEASRRLREGSLPARAVCVTFDDGYADNHDIALPILSRHGIPATVFVATGFLNGGMMWNDTIIETLRTTGDEELDLRSVDLQIFRTGTESERSASAGKILSAIKHLHPEKRQEVASFIAGFAGKLPDKLMMTDDQVRSLHNAGVEIGAHTRSHPILAALDPEEARTEIALGKKDLEKITGSRVTQFAYPNGKLDSDFNLEHRNLLPDLGFQTAVTTEPYATSPDSDLFMLPRFTPWDKTPLKFLVRLLHAYGKLDPETDPR
jgi:peptidoglycan/xylan/chitin deacetylase (PgdA/CDA1 family)